MPGIPSAQTVRPTTQVVLIPYLAVCNILEPAREVTPAGANLGSAVNKMGSIIPSTVAQAAIVAGAEVAA